MIKHIKNRIESVQDVNRTLKVLSTYVWIGSGVLFACYIYFVGALTFSIVKQKGLEQSIKAAISSMSIQELSYLNLQKDLTLSQALQMGLVEAHTISFVSQSRAFAFNAGR
jgi:hypothetical protein